MLGTQGQGSLKVMCHVGGKQLIDSDTPVFEVFDMSV